MSAWDEYINSDRNEVGQKIRSIREDLNLSQDKLAEYMDVERAQISRHERGLNDMSVGTFFKYADVLGVTPQTLSPERFNTASVSDQLNDLIPTLKQLNPADLQFIKTAAEHLLNKYSETRQN